MLSQKVYILSKKVYTLLDCILPLNGGILHFLGIVHAKNQGDAEMPAKFETQ
jgi:hypothetical protein